MAHSSRRKPQDLPQLEEIWHVFTFKMRTWIAERDKKPVRPEGLMIFDLTTGTVMAVEMAETARPEWVGEVLFKAMTHPVQGPGSRPHRPQMVTLPDAGLVAMLTPRLAEIGVECKQMDTPDEAYEMIASLESHMRSGHAEIPSLLSVDGVTPEFVGELFAAAAEFYRAAPWVKLVNAQALAVQLSDQAEPWYVSVMGNAGIEYGLSVSRTWADLQAITSGSGDEPMDAIPATGLRSLLFNSITELPFDDLEALEKYHWQVAGDDAGARAWSGSSSAA